MIGRATIMDMIRMHRRLALLLAAMLTALAMAGGTASVSAVTYDRATPFVVWEVPEPDIAGIGGQAKLLIKNFGPTQNIIKYLDTAQAHGYKVIVYFNDTVNYDTGTVYTSKVKPWVDKVKNHPALYGYLSVKEPSWFGVTVTEMRALYKAYKAADPKHPVIALFGDTPNFTTLPTSLRWNTSIANMLWVDWYPVTYSRGYIGTAATNFPKIRAYVDAHTPGTPIWLMVQGHRYDKGDKRSPTVDELTRQVRDGFTYLKANGIGFYTWNNLLYNRDFKRNTTLWGHAKTIVARVRGGTF